MTSPLLSKEEINWGAQTAPPSTLAAVAAPPRPAPPSYYRPLVDAADSFIQWAQTPEKRVNIGIPQIDTEMRGTAPGEMTQFIGHTHNGKTVVLLHGLKHNRDKRCVLFIPDEPATLVLAKLTSIFFGIDARELEAKVADGDMTAIRLLRETATEAFPNLAVFDMGMTPAVMERAVNEVSDHWGAPPELFVIDYLELVEGFETVPAAANFLKSFGREHEVPEWVLHQTSRSSGAGGKKLSIDSGAYGGAAQATSILGVRRKKFELLAERDELLAKRSRSDEQQHRLGEVEYELEVHAYTVTVSLLKNKRPGGSTIEDGVDLELNTSTGALRTIADHEFPKQYLNPFDNEPGELF